MWTCRFLQDSQHSSTVVVVVFIVNFQTLFHHLEQNFTKSDQMPNYIHAQLDASFVKYHLSPPIIVARNILQKIEAWR